MGLRRCRAILAGPTDEARWARIYIRQFEDRWAAIMCSDHEAPPQPDQLKGIGFFGDTPEEAEQQALDYLGLQVGRN